MWRGTSFVTNDKLSLVRTEVRDGGGEEKDEKTERKEEVEADEAEEWETAEEEKEKDIEEGVVGEEEREEDEVLERGRTIKKEKDKGNEDQ